MALLRPRLPGPQKAALPAGSLRLLRPGGRLGLLLAQGEVAPLFASRDQLQRLLETAGFDRLHLDDRDHVYRLATARAPR